MNFYKPLSLYFFYIFSMFWMLFDNVLVLLHSGATQTSVCGRQAFPKLTYSVYTSKPKIHMWLKQYAANWNHNKEDSDMGTYSGKEKSVIVHILWVFLTLKWVYSAFIP